ncbi:MAG: L-methionine transporter [Amphiamblys sp. WSBS2006]|nr:MAG: L-methionine transporter [Amphiamblys sp. WSBS2006]
MESDKEPSQHTENSLHQDTAGEHIRPAPMRTLGLWSCVALVIGNILGSGIFVAPGEVLSLAGTIELALFCWFFSGLVVFLGALCYIELGIMFPHSGADYQYLTRAYHPSIGFAYTWMMLLIYFPGSNALLSLTAARYILRMFGEASAQAGVLLKEKAVAGGICAFITLTNTLQTRYGVILQGWLAVFKLLFVLLICISSLGFIFITGIPQNSAVKEIRPLSFSGIDPLELGFAFYNALWAYDGWNSVNLAAGEVVNPAEVLPRATCISIPIIVLCYIAVNLSYMAVLPEKTIRDSRSLVVDLGTLIYGGPAVKIVASVSVALIAVGALNGLVLVGARLAQTCASDALIPKALAYLHPTRHTPVAALLFNFILGCIFIALFSFNSIIRQFMLSTWLFFLLSTVSVIVFRVREPKKERPFRVWIVAPVLFALFALSAVLFPFFSSQAIEAAIVFGSILLSFPVWLFFHYEHNGHTAASRLCFFCR